MLRLADRILERAPRIKSRFMTELILPTLVLNDCKIVAADNVYNFLWPTLQEENQTGKSHSLLQGCGRLPFKAAFIEWDTAPGVWVPQDSEELIKQVGILCREFSRRQILNVVTTPIDYLPETERVILGVVVYYTSFDKLKVDTNLLLIELNQEGSILAVREQDTPHTESNLATSIILTHTLAFMNCKNVVIQDDTPEYAQPAKWYRRTKVPQVSYHTINIQPTTIRRNPNPTSTDIQQRLHICRGHFMHYKEDGPGMFGRGVYGRFWVPQHQRGSSELGIVHSRYNVSPPGD
jgi:hypothetical protein